MNITLACRLKRESLTAEEIYDCASATLGRLASVDAGFERWWSMSRKINDTVVAFDDRVGTIALIQANRVRFEQKYPGVPSSLSSGVLLTNAQSEDEWAKRGRVALAINPGAGDVRLEISRMEEVYSSPSDVTWSLLKAMTLDERVTFAKTDVQQGSGKDRKLYSLHCAVFQHRGVLGWMGYVNQPVTAERVPDATRVERHGQGTLIMATREVDLFDAHSVERVNRVEISLAELGLLPVTDPGI